MMNVRGWARDRLGTLRAAIALIHPHLVWLRMRDKHRFFSYARPVFQGYVQSLNPHVAVAPIGDVLRRIAAPEQPVSARLPHLEGYVGLSDWERVTLASLLACRLDRPCFEIGTAAGSTALLLACNTDQQVFTLDLPDDFAAADFSLTRMHTDDQVIAGRKRAELIHRAGSPANIVELTGDSAKFDYAPYHGRIGVFFVDGAHSYEYVRSDTIQALRCLAPDGILVWHDFGSSRDVSRFLNELAAAGCKILAVERTTIALSTDLEKLSTLLGVR